MIFRLADFASARCAVARRVFIRLQLYVLLIIIFIFISVVVVVVVMINTKMHAQLHAATEVSARRTCHTSANIALDALVVRERLGAHTHTA